MKRILSLICAMFLACVFAVNAQNPVEKIVFSGTLVNPTTSLQDYVIQAVQTGKEKRLLEQVKPEVDGSFNITVMSDKPVRLIVLDKKRDVVFRRMFFATEGNNKLVLDKIDLSKTPQK